MPSDIMIYELNQLQGYADNFHGTVSAMETIDSNLKQILGDNATGCWKGMASEEFAEKIEKTYGKFTELLNLYRQEYQMLTAAIAVYRAHEGIIENDVTHLTTDDIF